MNPLKFRFAKGLVANLSDSGIVERMKRLEKLGKGTGNDMYDALVKILEEDSRPK